MTIGQRGPERKDSAEISSGFGIPAFRVSNIGMHGLQSQDKEDVHVQNPDQPD